ncbi:hydroxysqualene dehydroxylase HpnE [Amycolatopsis acidiphila]|uniref:FAD-dependent oxidoreductase n=1 Tax=Amycolatopsis acidiphila TaxID=715473 RepID=A0A558A3X9_9PSEU|nr:hydroxysqualene dehydroxylase HpnE [Amycolatopsis acidiphila]TVT18984.1 FAD-dependent oxidoreductase [Amycolatopsis acidiphila]UIJ56671.1 hydroxysqualene dehydroxylase HpnE [Amycolatopsis acidiphila]GHG55878.1 phytoene dehydrogenase [Amycolatopsis acidiphila]
MTPRVAVIGGGLAGITAALRCADAGLDVTLLESKGHLGGLTHSFRRGELDVDNGQHVFLRCCTSYLDLLRRLRVLDKVHLQPRLAIQVRSPRLREPVWLRRNALPAPLHLADSVLKYRPLPLADRLKFAGAALALRGVDPASPSTDAQSFAGWLSRHGQSERAITKLWDLVGIATLNAPATDASLALAATVFQLGLLTDAAAADIGWSKVPLRELHGDPAKARLTEAGAQVLLGTKVTALTRADDGWRVVAGETEFVADRVVLAVPPDAAHRLLPAGSVSLPEGWAARLGSSPIVNAHVVFDRRVLDEPFFAAVDSPVQWVFDRTAQSGVDSGQYLAVSLSAADDLVDVPVRDVRERILPALRAVLPAAADAGVRDFFVTRERHATFRPAPGSAALRPGAVTAAGGVVLAGAWTATGWPATMEGAVRSGDAAARAVLGVAGVHDGSTSRESKDD